MFTRERQAIVLKVNFGGSVDMLKGFEPDVSQEYVVWSMRILAQLDSEEIIEQVMETPNSIFLYVRKGCRTREREIYRRDLTKLIESRCNLRAYVEAYSLYKASIYAAAPYN